MARYSPFLSIPFKYVGYLFENVETDKKTYLEFLMLWC